MTVTKEAIEAAKSAYWHEAHNGGGYSDKCYEAALTAALPFLSPIAGKPDMLRLAVAAVLEADKEFRANMPPEWEGDPLSDEIDGLRRVYSALTSSPGKDGGQEVEVVSHGRYTDLIKALSRLSGNRQSDGVSSLVSRDDREAIITGCHDLMIAARQSPAAQPARLTKALEWEYHERPMMTYVASDERGMMYHINQAFGSDSYYLATVRFDGAILYDGDDLPSAKQAAQTDHEARILSALTSSEHTHRLVENLTKALKPFARIADMEERLQDGESTMVNISRCRDARSALSASTSREGER